MIKNKKTLFVDDDARFIKFLSLYFNKADFALNAQEARQIIHQKGPFDIVVTDWDMPQEDGLSFARFVKNAWPDTELFLLSSKSPQDLFDGIKALSKPIKLEALSSILYGTVKKT